MRLRQKTVQPRKKIRKIYRLPLHPRRKHRVVGKIRGTELPCIIIFRHATPAFSRTCSYLSRFLPAANITYRTPPPEMQNHGLPAANIREAKCRHTPKTVYLYRSKASLCHSITSSRSAEGSITSSPSPEEPNAATKSKVGRISIVNSE